MPYPYKAMLAFCSDLDETTDRHVYWEIMRFLNTMEETSVGGRVWGWKFGHELLTSESFFKMTSDDFFPNHTEQVLLHQRVDVALVDGLHEFSHAL